MPLILLSEAGLQTAKLQSIHSSPRPGKVNYVFTEGELNQVSLVFNKTVDAAAFSNLNWDYVMTHNDELSDAFRILRSGRPVLRSVILVRKNLDPNLREKITELLLDLDQTEDGRKVLKKYNKVEQYSLFDEKALKSWRWIAEFRRKLTGQQP